MPVERIRASQIDLLDTVLDKGIVVDAWACVSRAGIDLTNGKSCIVVSVAPDGFEQHAKPVTARPPQTAAGD